MKHSEFEALLKVKKKDLDIEKLAKDVSADLTGTIEKMHYTSQKFFLAHESLKTPQFRKFCRLIPISYSVAYRHVKVAELMKREECQGKFKRIDSWGTLHAIALLTPVEFKSFMSDMGGRDIHFTKGDVQKYNRRLQAERENNKLYDEWQTINSITYNIHHINYEKSLEDMKKLIEFSKTLKFIRVDYSYDSFLENSTPQLEHLIQGKKNIIKGHEDYLKILNSDKEIISSKEGIVSDDNRLKVEILDKHITYYKAVIGEINEECEKLLKEEKERIKDVEEDAEKWLSYYANPVTGSVKYDRHRDVNKTAEKVN